VNKNFDLNSDHHNHSGGDKSRLYPKIGSDFGFFEVWESFLNKHLLGKIDYHQDSTLYPEKRTKVTHYCIKLSFY